LAEEKLYNNLDVTVATALKNRREVTARLYFTYWLSVHLSASHSQFIYKQAVICWKVICWKRWY